MVINVQRGLERISAAWWGLCSLFFVAVLVEALTSDPGKRLGLLAGAIGGGLACYVAHRLTCWIVAGFFAPRS